MGYLATQGVFIDPKDFSAQIKIIRDMGDAILKSKLPQMVSISDANALVDANYKVQLELHSQFEKMMSDITNVWVMDTITMAFNSSQNYNIKYVMPLQARVTAAKNAGATAVSTEGFNRNLSMHLFNIAGTYEAFQHLESVKPFLLRNMPETLRLIANLGRIWERVVEIASTVLGAVTDAAAAMGSGLGKIGTIIKWGTIAGGLYLLWKHVLKPKKKPAKS